MRKRLIPPKTPRKAATEPDWLGLETAAEAEVTSEDPAFPIESALGITPGPGWQASAAGPQTIRLLFDHPLRVRRIHVEFREEQRERRQEFVLRWSGDSGQTWREIVRQQYNFSAGARREVEEYKVDLDHATGFEMEIVPDTTGGEALASLYRLQIA